MGKINSFEDLEVWQKASDDTDYTLMFDKLIQLSKQLRTFIKYLKDYESKKVDKNKN